MATYTANSSSLHRQQQQFTPPTAVAVAAEMLHEVALGGDGSDGMPILAAVVAQRDVIARRYADAMVLSLVACCLLCDYAAAIAAVCGVKRALAVVITLTLSYYYHRYYFQFLVAFDLTILVLPLPFLLLDLIPYRCAFTGHMLLARLLTIIGITFYRFCKILLYC